MNAFDGYYHYGLCYTTIFHPQIIGKPGGLMLLDRLLTYIERFPTVWRATAQEIASRCAQDGCVECHGGK
jgi:hypothetical protein